MHKVLLQTPKELNFLRRYILWFARLIMLSVFSLNLSCGAKTVPRYLYVWTICTSSLCITLGFGLSPCFLKSIINSLVLDKFYYILCILLLCEYTAKTEQRTGSFQPWCHVVIFRFCTTLCQLCKIALNFAYSLNVDEKRQNKSVFNLQ